MNKLYRSNTLAALALLATAGCASAQPPVQEVATAKAKATSMPAWKPAQGPLMTRWAKDVSPTNALPDYPRPQMVRKAWMNLNGLWQYQAGNEGDAVPFDTKLASQILVPYPVESALSGVMEHHERLWYRRNFTVPAAWKNKQVMINFGAVDYESEIYLNGKSLGIHKGGYESFKYNLTPYLKGTGPQELIVRVFDPTEAGGQPRGKQTTKPGGIMYTPTTGIWQTVWLEPVAADAIDNLHMIPDVDKGTVRFTVNATGETPDTTAVIKIKDGKKVIQTVTVKPGVETAIPIANAKLWSPDSPFLYDVDVTLMDGKKTSDTVSSYFGMRKISIGMDGGFNRMLLNNKFTFEIGPLDQGFWPDGIYTPPTEDAMKNDLQTIKNLGFNMIRKHIKVEPARWYYWCDRMGLLVWQDMPSCNSYIGNPPPIDTASFKQEVDQVIRTHWNSPSIIMWVIFNEGQARHDTPELVNMAKTLDPSRLTDRDSGGGYEDDRSDGTVGDVDDVHSYPPPNGPAPSTTGQATACGEYGGLGFIVPNHTWNKPGWGYATMGTTSDLEDTYGEYTNILKKLSDEKGLSAAVYTQITDVEVESNGLMTYDRLLKMDPAKIALANHFKYPSPTYKVIVPTSEVAPQTWKYSFDAPAADWNKTTFDDAAWKTGQSGFGAGNGTPPIGTPWNTGDIWMRRKFTLGPLSADELNQLMIHSSHDEDTEVFINGVLAYKATGFITAWENKPLSAEAKKALVPGENTIAVHVHQTIGGQYADAGLTQRIPAK